MRPSIRVLKARCDEAWNNMHEYNETKPEYWAWAKVFENVYRQYLEATK